MAASQPVAYTIEPFDPSKHDRAAFSCGVEQVDNYFQKTANKLAKADNVRLYVIDCGDPDRVARRKALYESYGFEPLPSNPLRMFRSVSTVRKLIAEEDDMPKKDAALADLARLGQEFDRG